MSQPVLTVNQMRKLDAYVINRDNAAKKLMGRAGNALAEELKPFSKIAIVCGSGNNGGDGYAATFALQNEGLLDGKTVDIYYTKQPKSEESSFFFNSITHRNVNIEKFDSNIDLSNYDAIADCLLGTGFSGSPKQEIAQAIEAINSAKKNNVYVISMDINSGVNGDSGEGTVAVKSDLTLSIGYLKVGMLKPEFKKWASTIKNRNIGYELTEDNLEPFSTEDGIKFI